MIASRQRAVETVPPAGSRAQALAPGAHFSDAWSITSSRADASALELFIAAARRTPRWIDACMALRNRAVAAFGLKDLGRLSGIPAGKAAASYRPGERVGIFTLFEDSFDEALLGDRDRHLDVVVSVHRRAIPGGGRVAVTVTTIVHVKNLLGRLYMLPVKPMHRLIAPAVMRTLADGDPAA